MNAAGWVAAVGAAWTLCAVVVAPLVGRRLARMAPPTRARDDRTIEPVDDHPEGEL